MNHHQNNSSSNNNIARTPVNTSVSSVGIARGPGVVGPGAAVLRGRGQPNIKVKRKCIEIICEPCAIFLMTTILCTALATALLSIALTSRYWEMMIYDQEKLKQLVENRTHLSVHWFFDGRVPRIAGTTGGISTTEHHHNNVKSHHHGAATQASAYAASGNQQQQQQQGKYSSQNFRKRPNTATVTSNSGGGNHESGHEDDGGFYSFSTHPDTEVDVSGSYVYANDENNLVFLLPLHSGVWISCIDVTEQEFGVLQTLGYNNDVHCVDHLNPDLPKPTDARASWQHRMQNLAIACALVCLILLGAAIVVGLFGILRRQISAVLVTGVIYVLAALFALFTLTIVHLKHKNRQERDPLDVWTRLTPDYTEFRSARIISHGWSLQLAWAGSFVCVLASIMWMLLSKIMRYNPISLLP